VVTIASTHALIGAPERSTYGIVKAAQVQMTRMLAVEWAQHGIRVNAIAPGRMENGIALARRDGRRSQIYERRCSIAFRLHRLCTPEEVAAAVVYLASPQAASITGQVLVLDGWFDGGLRALSIEFRAVISVRSRARRCEAMTLPRRPRAGGDPYAAAMSCGTAGDKPNPWCLWVPACAGTTADSSVPRILGDARKGCGVRPKKTGSKPRGSSRSIGSSAAASARDISHQVPAAAGAVTPQSRPIVRRAALRLPLDLRCLPQRCDRFLRITRLDQMILANNCRKVRAQASVSRRRA